MQQRFDPEQHLMELLANEVRAQCAVALLAAGRAYAVSEGRAPDDEPWAWLDAMVVAFANIDKLLWGSTWAREARRAPLRDMAGVDDDSALKGCRRFRNNIEHIDAEIEDDWDAQAKRPGPWIIVDRNVGVGPEDLGFMLGDQRGHFRHYDPPTDTYSFGDDSLNLSWLLHEVVVVATQLGGVRFPAEFRGIRGHPKPKDG